MSRSFVPFSLALLLLIIPFALSAQHVQTPPAQDDDFSVFLFAILLAGISIMIGAAIFGSFLAMLLFFCFIGLVSAGILSASIMVGLYKRSLAAGFKTLLIIVCSIGGAILGMISFYFVNDFFKLDLKLSTSLVSGAVSGILGGVLLGISLSFIFRTLFAYFRNKLIA
ncbi:MAG TPA: hypothetical protein VK563_17090 [Puia sp.]|nr:hypothetical protein [Puia sp.]